MTYSLFPHYLFNNHTRRITKAKRALLFAVSFAVGTTVVMSDMINEFLSLSMRRVRNGVLPSCVGVVLGNEAGDLDSVVGSIYLSFLLNENKGELRIDGCVPVLNFPKKDLVLRNEVSHALNHFGIRTDMLLSASADSPKDVFVDLSQGTSPIVLYDHNTLAPSQTHLAARVSGVVDHHHDDAQYTASTHPLRIIEPVGSACTLVAQMYQKMRRSAPLPELLAAPILLDTSNFDVGQKKVTPADIAAVEWLTSRARTAAANTVLYQLLSHWKSDIFFLSFEENLRRDYKQFTFASERLGKNIVLGISSMPCSFVAAESHYSQDAMAAECARFCHAHALDGLLLMLAGTAEDGRRTREVVAIAATPYLEVLTEYAKSAPGGVTFAERVSRTIDPGKYSLVCYALDDVSVSRKRLAPSLAQYLKTSRSSVL